MQQLVTVDVNGIPAQMTIEQWQHYYNQTGILFTSSEDKRYIVGCDPYHKIKKPRMMQDRYSRKIEPGQLIMTKNFSVGLVVSMTSGGNPRCIPYDLEKEKLMVYTHRPYDWKIKGPSKTKKAGDILPAAAWTEYHGIILREVGNPKTELPPTVVITKEFTKNPMFDI
jgi:hypothetical protein